MCQVEIMQHQQQFQLQHQPKINEQIFNNLSTIVDNYKCKIIKFIFSLIQNI